MIVVDLENIDWTAFRQVVALSLATGRDCSIRGLGQLFDHIHNRRMWKVLKNIMELIPGVDVIERDNQVRIISSGLKYGIYHVETHRYAPVTDIILTLAPALSNCEFVSELHLKGVTHSPYSHPASFLKTSLNALITDAGYTVASSLKKFGFYGSGDGEIVTKIYPMVKHANFILPVSYNWEMVSARVYVAKIDTAFASYQKEYLAKELHIDANSISIMEIVNSSGYGNHIDVNIRGGDMEMVESMTMMLYNADGDFVFTDDSMRDSMKEFCARIKNIIDDKKIPYPLLREAIPFIKLAGLDCDEYNDAEDTGMELTRRLCQLFSL
ncbi:MAG: RNA 3'-terminal phosphate cyclase [Spirochaetota bacterium]